MKINRELRVTQIVREAEELVQSLSQVSRLHPDRYQFFQSLFFRLIDRLNREADGNPQYEMQNEEGRKIKELKKKFFQNSEKIQARLKHLDPVKAFQKKANFYLKKLNYHRQQIAQLQEEFSKTEDPKYLQRVFSHKEEIKVAEGNLKALLSFSSSDTSIVALQEEIKKNFQHP
ncbi:MAG: hypothetical protein Tsb0015_16590 [Simkaniaceae bacterium]